MLRMVFMVILMVTIRGLSNTKMRKRIGNSIVVVKSTRLSMRAGGARVW